MRIRIGILITEIILRAKWPSEWIEKFKESKLSDIHLIVQSQNGEKFEIYYEEDAEETTVTLEQSE